MPLRPFQFVGWRSSDRLPPIIVIGMRPPIWPDLAPFRRLDHVHGRLRMTGISVQRNLNRPTIAERQ